MAALMQADLASLIAIDGIGDTLAQNIVFFFVDDRARTIVV